MSLCTLATVVLLAAFGYSQDPTKQPTVEWSQYGDGSYLVESILSFMSPDDLDALHPMTSTMMPSEMYNLSKWQELGNDSAYAATWGAVYSDAELSCMELNLSSSLCYDDCIAYNSPPQMLRLGTSLNGQDQDRSIQILKWYTVSGGPISWNNPGNVDMCQFFEGTYCYTPSTLSFDEAGVSAVFHHGCCVPATCTGWDAMQVAMSNDWCYKKYQMFAGAFSEPEWPICEPIERDLQETGAWSTIIVFLILLSCIVTASVLRRCWLEHSKADTKMVDSHSFIKLFNVQSIWSAFGRTRPTDKSTFNFLDGIRVWSMTWVCPYALCPLSLSLSLSLSLCGRTAMT